MNKKLTKDKRKSRKRAKQNEVNKAAMMMMMMNIWRRKKFGRQEMRKRENAWGQVVET